MLRIIDCYFAVNTVSWCN